MNMQNITFENNLNNSYLPLNKMGTTRQQQQSSTKNRQNSSDIVDNLGKHCDNPDCTAPSLISLVQQKTNQQIPQLIQEPSVVEDPLLISGYTTVFQITGKKANIPSQQQLNDNDIDNNNKPIYKVIPNTHAHIVNFVVVDSDGEMFRKIKDSDPITLKKLMDAQKSSADQLLNKLIGIENSIKKNHSTKNINDILLNLKNNQQNTGLNKNLPQSQQQQNQLRQMSGMTISNPKNITTTSPVTSANSNSTGNINIPMQQEESNNGNVDSKLNFNIPTNIIVRTNIPTSSAKNIQNPGIIKTLHRSRGRPRLYPKKSPTAETNRQSPTNQQRVHSIGHPNLKITSVQSIGTNNSNCSSPALAEKTDLEKMREEINELRETVKKFASTAGGSGKEINK